MHKTTHLSRLSPLAINQVITDLKLVLDGALLIFAVDPFDVIDFCFPLVPGVAAPRPDMSLDELADDQVALFEVFYGMKQKALLLPEYAEELYGFYDYLHREIANVHKEVQLLAAMDTPTLHEALHKERHQRSNGLDLAEHKYNRIIALLLGVYNIGFDRLHDLVTKRSLNNFIDTSEGEQIIVRQIFSAYRASDLVDRLCGLFEPSYAKLEEKGFSGRAAMIRHNDRNDAHAIDRIIYLNRAFENAFREGQVTRRVIVLFVSSAQKPQAMFNSTFLPDYYPLIAARPYPILRQREQLFAYVATRQKSDQALDGVRQAIDRLVELEALMRKREELFKSSSSTKCAACALSGGKDKECSSYSFCTALAEIEASLWDRRENLGLVTGTIDMTRQFIAYREEVKEHERKYGVYSAFVNKLISKPDIATIVSNRIDVTQHILLGQARLRSFAQLAVKNTDETDVERDAVTGAFQVLPTEVVVSNPQLEKLRQKIVQFPLIPFRERTLRSSTLEELIQEFAEIEATVLAKRNEVDIMRCLIYMILPTVNAGIEAFAHATDLVEQNRAADSYYVAAWAARRTRKYAVGEDFCNEWLRRWPNDGRAALGRALNSYAWLADEACEPKCRRSVRTAINDLSKAEKRLAREGSVRLVVACLNDMAFLYAWKQGDVSFDLAKARAHLDRLKRMYPRSEWAPSHPEFFHTEAFIEHEEYMEGLKRGSKSLVLRVKLENAAREIKAAIELNPTRSSYLALAEEIQRAMSQINDEEEPAV